MYCFLYQFYIKKTTAALSQYRQDYAHCHSSSSVIIPETVSGQIISPTGIWISPSDLPLIISVAVPTSSPPLLSLLALPSPHPPLQLITSALSLSTFLTPYSSSPLSPHPSSHVRVSNHPARRFITATWQSTLPCNTRVHTYTDQGQVYPI